MANRIGLYYPYIEFRDDSWVKFAALYWDKLGRIVPRGYKPRDTKTIRQLRDDLGFIVNFEPSPEDLECVANMFFEVLDSHKEELVSHYGITSKREIELKPRSVSKFQSPKVDKSDPDFPNTTEIFASKMYVTYDDIARALDSMKDQLYQSVHGLTSDELERAIAQKPELTLVTRDLRLSLIHEGLALPVYVGDKQLGKEVVKALRMHSKLAFIYMDVLAEKMAAVRLLNPVADDLLAHFAVNGFTFDRLVQVLLEPSDSKAHLVTSRRWDEIEAQMATVALKSVLPKDITNVSVEKIIKLRKNHRDEMTLFQNYIHEFVTDLEGLQDIEDPMALKAHLETEYEKKLKPQYEDLKKLLRSLGIDTAEGLMNIRVGLPPFVATTADYLAQAHAIPSINPIVAGAGALAFSVFPVIRQKRRQIKETALSTPAAYLLYAQEGLEPANFVSQVTRKARQILYGV